MIDAQLLYKIWNFGPCLITVIKFASRCIQDDIFGNSSYLVPIYDSFDDNIYMIWWEYFVHGSCEDLKDLWSKYIKLCCKNLILWMWLIKLEVQLQFACLLMILYPLLNFMISCNIILLSSLLESNFTLLFVNFPPLNVLAEEVAISKENGL